MDAELSKNFESAVVINEEARAHMEPATEPSPYSSPFITLCVGPESAKQVKYCVHQDVLLHIPFFKAALRPDAFIEGAENKITFEEEDPAVFGKLVEFIYVGDISSRGKQANQYSVQNTLFESGEEHYDHAKHACGILCGTHISTPTTHQLFETTVLVLCLANRYAMNDLVACSLKRLEDFPIGTKEVSVLARHVLENIHEGNTEVYLFLEDKFSLFRSRLGQCEVFQDLLKSDDILLIKGLLKLMAPSNPLTGARLRCPEWEKYLFAICIKDVTAEESLAKWSSDNYWNSTSFGTALKGEILITNGQCDEWGIFQAGHPSVRFSDSWLSYPVSSFELLDNVSWRNGGGESWGGGGSWEGGGSWGHQGGWRR